MSSNRKHLYPAAFILICCTMPGCRQHPANGGDGSDSSKKTVIVDPAANVPENRAQPKREPVDTYREKTDNPLNDWYFTVSLFETSQTFQYRVSMQFEEIKGEDTLNLPNLGTFPQPVLKKGKDRYSCIIGFMDPDHVFHEYKLVHVENGNQLKITTLKHYAVTSSPRS